MWSVFRALSTKLSTLSPPSLRRSRAGSDVFAEPVGHQRLEGVGQFLGLGAAVWTSIVVPLEAANIKSPMMLSP
jgi:hypothetical protein